MDEADMELVSDESLNDAEGDTLDNLTPIADEPPEKAEKADDGVGKNAHSDTSTTAAPQGVSGVVQTPEGRPDHEQGSSNVSAEGSVRGEAAEVGDAAR